MDRYRAMQEHWREFGPPAYMGVALYLGLTKFKKSGGDGGGSSGGSDLMTNPEDIANYLRTLEGGTVRT